MLSFADITGCKAIIRDTKDGQVLAETVIRAYTKATHLAVVDAKYFPCAESMQVSLTILTSTGVLECLGILRRAVGSAIREIALFKMLAKDSRRKERYALCTRATIEHLVAGDQLVPMSPPLEVTVENISAGGIMLSTQDPLLDVGAAFLLKLDIAGSPTYIHTSIVRLAQAGQTRSFGCIFHAVCNEQGHPLG